MAESRGSNFIFRSSDTSLLIRAVLFDATDAKITAGTTSLRIWHVIPTTGALETYDFNDNTFKTGAVTTPTVAMTHRQAENNTYNTGYWNYRHTTLGPFVVGDKYIFEVSHANLPRPITAEYQYGDLEGDEATLIPDFVWDEDIVGAHGAASSAGLLLRSLGANISTRTNNANLNALLGVADTAGFSIAHTIWNALLASHNVANTMGSTMNAVAASGSPSAAAIAIAVWDENIVAAHGAASSAGFLLRVLGAAISTRVNNATLNALLGVPDVASTNLSDAIWDEDIVAAHGAAATAGFLVRTLGASISTRANNPTLNALLGVPDVLGADVPGQTTDEVWDEVLDGAHNVIDSSGRRLRTIDDLSEVGGAGDLTDIRTQVRKIDKTANDSPAAAGSLARKIDDLTTIINNVRNVVVAINLEGSAIRIECAVERFGVVELTPWVQCSAQIFDEANGIVATFGVGDFGAIGPRGFFTVERTPHLLVAGQTYQVRIVITDGAALQIITSKVIKVIQS